MLGRNSNISMLQLRGLENFSRKVETRLSHVCLTGWLNLSEVGCTAKAKYGEKETTTPCRKIGKVSENFEVNCQVISMEMIETHE